MPVYLAPGVYIEEIPSGAKPIEGVATSVAAFIGPAGRGPVGEATLIGSLDDYKAAYGDISSENDEMGLAVQAFYLNGGKDAYICRLAGDTVDTATDTIDQQGALGAVTLNIDASSPGAWGNEVFYRVIKPDVDSLTFDLEIGHREDGEFVADEEFSDLTMLAGDDLNAVTVVEDGSTAVRLTLGPASDPDGAPDYLPAVITGADTNGVADYFSTTLGTTSATIGINVDGRGAETFTIPLAALAGASHGDDATEIANQLNTVIQATTPTDIYGAVTVAWTGTNFTITRANPGNDESTASLTLVDGLLAQTMLLTSASRTTLTGIATGGGDDDFSTGVAAIVAPAPLDLQMTIDGQAGVTVTLNRDDVTLTGDNQAEGDALALAVQTAARNAAPLIPAFRGIEVSYDGGTQMFTLRSGAGSPLTSGFQIGDTPLAALMGVRDADTPTVTAGRTVQQAVSNVIPVATANPQGAQLAGGVDAAPGGTDYSDFYGEVLRKRRDVTMMILPGQPWTTTGPTAAISASIAHAEAMRNRMVILDPPPGVELRTAVDVGDLGTPTSTYTCMYYPWVNAPNPLKSEATPAAPNTVLLPPSAYAAGIWTKTDGRRGVWKAPAGVETRLIGATSLEFEVEDTEQGQLNPLGINCYRKIPSFGNVVWGSRTLATKAAPEWRYVPVRRTAIFIEQSIYNGIQWAVFEPNAHPLWGSLRANIGGFMDGLFRGGAFQGEKADDAYFVRCGLGDTMTQTDIDAGRVIVVVGFAPLKPAEFVIVRIQQKVGQD